MSYRRLTGSRSTSPEVKGSTTQSSSDTLSSGRLCSSGGDLAELRDVFPDGNDVVFSNIFGAQAWTVDRCELATVRSPMNGAGPQELLKETARMAQTPYPKSDSEEAKETINLEKICADFKIQSDNTIIADGVLPRREVEDRLLLLSDKEALNTRDSVAKDVADYFNGGKMENSEEASGSDSEPVHRDLGPGAESEDEEITAVVKSNLYLYTILYAIYGEKYDCRMEQEEVPFSFAKERNQQV